MGLTIFKGVAGLFSILIALVSYRFLLIGLEDAFSVMQFHIEARRLSFLVHVASGPVALAIGVLQFSRRLRERFATLHRWMGRLYGLAVGLSGTAALLLAAHSLDRPVAASGFGLLALAWMVFTARAIYLARAQRFAEHRQWMIRSFALTFAAVTLRLQLPVFLGPLGMDYLEASSYLGWLCWVPNLLVAEWWIARETKRGAEAPLAT